ncbi:Holliday junction ATP-dependent DNA helicase RuvA [Streptomyces tendae]
MERVFSQHNVRTVMGTAQASAVAILCASRRGIPVALHTPSEVKAAVTGSGRADKAQVGAMVTRLLRLDAPPKPADAADALALAICHIWRAPAQNRLQQAVAAHGAPRGPRRPPPGPRGPPLERPYGMIAFVSGTVAALTPDTAVVEVGGVGMAVRCTPDTLSTLRVGRPAKLATSLVVREDSLTLYGFADEDGRQVFELLQTASGVGPRLAQAMLAVHNPDALRRAVATGDEKALTAVPGIGKKGAQKLLLELKDRLGEPTGAPAVGAPVTAGWRDQLHAALIGLGYATREADEAVAAVTPQAEAAEGAVPVGQLLKAALQTLNRAR